MHAASTYKLPLNMYYYEQEAAGVFGPDTYVGGSDLAEAHYLSIVWSDNYVSEAMIYYLGTFGDYKTLMNDYYGQMSQEELADIYWHDNYYCTKFMMNTLLQLYYRMDEFQELVGYMIEAAPAEDLNLYSGQMPVAHKVGEYETHFNDVGITFTEHPFLIAVYTDDIDIPGEVIGRINAALIAYQEKQARQAAEEAAAEEARLQEEAAAAEEARLLEEAQAAEEERLRAEAEAQADQAISEESGRTEDLSEAEQPSGQTGGDPALRDQAAQPGTSGSQLEGFTPDAVLRDWQVLMGIFAGLGVLAVLVVVAIIAVIRRQR